MWQVNGMPLRYLTFRYYLPNWADHPGDTTIWKVASQGQATSLPDLKLIPPVENKILAVAASHGHATSLPDF